MLQSPQSKESVPSTDPTAHPAAPGALPSGRIRLPALLLGLLLIAANHVWIVYLEIVRYSMPTYIAPFYNVIFTLAAVTLLNLAVARRRPQWALNRLELMALYAMLSVATALNSSDMLGVLVAVMGYPHYFASDSNRWGKLILPYLPDWLCVRDPVALRGFFTGNTHLYQWVYLKAWAVPVLAWTVFTFVLVFTLMALTSLLSRQWMSRERLTYPIVELPFQMSEGAPFFRNRLMWIGFAITAGTTLLNGLNYLYPSIPAIPLKRQNISYMFSTFPWNAMGGTQVAFYPFVVSICFLMPQDLSFSAWFFYILYKLELVMSAASGMTSGPGNRFPYHEDQALGAYLCILVFAAYKSRRVLVGPLRSLLDPRRRNDPEARGERRALLGSLAGLTFLVLFAMQAGMTWWLAVGFFLMYFGLAVLASRIRTELGFPIIDLTYTQPHQALVRLWGSEAFGSRDLAVFGLFHWFNRIYRSQPMPHMAEADKLADRAGSPLSQMRMAVSLSILAAVPLSFWAYLDMYYRRGAGSGKVEIWALGFGRELFNRLADWMRTPSHPDPGSMWAVAVGFIVAAGMAVARTRFFWFPFHPLAYAVANGWGMHNVWSCVLLGWLLKITVLRYGGLQKYRAAIPFFLGLMLGEIVVGSLWTLAGIALDIRTYDFWP